jgi:hypothetical protein
VKISLYELQCDISDLKEKIFKMESMPFRIWCCLIVGEGLLIFALSKLFALSTFVSLLILLFLVLIQYVYLIWYSFKRLPKKTINLKKKLSRLQNKLNNAMDTTQVEV